MAPTINATVIGGLIAAVVLIGLGPPLGKRFGRFLTTRSLPLHILNSESGVSVHISPIGCAIQKLLVPDSRGRLKDIVLGFDDLTAYLVRECGRPLLTLSRNLQKRHSNVLTGRPQPLLWSRSWALCK